MEVPIIYIGFAQALFTILIFLLKRPFKIADGLLCVLLLAITSMFLLNIIQYQLHIQSDTWIFSLSISFVYPASLYLYSKYLTKEIEQFKLSDLLHFTPTILSVLALIFYGFGGKSDFLSNLVLYNKQLWLRDILGYSYLFFLWYYGILALKNVKQFRSKIKEIYSYKSASINLIWLHILVIAFLIVHNIIVVISTLNNYKIFTQHIDLIRDVSLLVYVYMVSIWGYQQKPLIKETKETNTAKYQKSGLKDDQANEHLKKLIDFMEETEAWKDNELTVAKLSMQTKIPKHHITQVLNEELQKNFFTFVNEYRVEHAKELISSEKYQAWTLVAIAYECGFNSKTAFNNFFKKHTEMTPSEYKKSLSTPTNN